MNEDDDHDKNRRNWSINAQERGTINTPIKLIKGQIEYVFCVNAIIFIVIFLKQISFPLTIFFFFNVEYPKLSEGNTYRITHVFIDIFYFAKYTR